MTGVSPEEARCKQKNRARSILRKIKGGIPKETQVNWIARDAAKANPRNDRIILENPQTVVALDRVLLETYLPFIRGELGKTGYHYSPSDTELSIKSTGMATRLARSITFSLLDHIGFLFLRFSISCNTLGYMVEKEFFLDLPESTDPKFLVKILGDPRFAGNPPTLMVQRHELHPEWGRFFWITMQAGAGFDSGPWELHGEAKADIAQTIECACQMYEISMVEGFNSLEDVDHFLEVACRSFESS